MIVRILLVVLISGGAAAAKEAASKPSTRPATRPIVVKSGDVAKALSAVVKDAEPTAPKPSPEPNPKPIEPKEPRPAKNEPKPSKQSEPVKEEPVKVVPVADGEKEEKAFPTAKEIMARLQQQKQQEQSMKKVAFIDLNRPLTEKPMEFSLFGEDGMTLASVLGRLRQAQDQKDVKAVLINLGATSFNLAQAQEIRQGLIDLTKAGKKTFVYADTYDTASYIAATGASNICMLEGGEIMMPGVGMETLFAKGLLDKIGVKADYVQIGVYKGADEQYTRTEPSAEMRGELNKILDSLYGQIVDGISYHRNLRKGDVEDAINGVMLTGRAAKDRGFVDHMIDQDGLRELLKKELAGDINLLHDFGSEPRDEVDFSNPFALFASMAKKPKESNKPEIALIYAEGVIMEGSSGEGMLGGGFVGSESIRKAMRMASRDEQVHAIVLRIDSPGGSATASEIMWQAIRRAAKDKPVIVSIGGMAASGGYYIACAGDHIFADPSAIVGSIGVVGGKFVMKDLFGKIGLNTETFTRGANADLFSSSKPFTEQQRRIVTQWMKNTYEQFTDRVMTTRKESIKDIDEVAHGRIFIAKQAKELGMVDELGGLDKAIAHAAAEAELDQGEFEIRVIPRTKTLADLFMGTAEEARMPFQPRISLDEGLMGVLSPSAAALVRQQSLIFQLLQQKPVMLVSPYLFKMN